MWFSCSSWRIQQNRIKNEQHTSNLIFFVSDLKQKQNRRQQNSPVNLIKIHKHVQEIIKIKKIEIKSECKRQQQQYNLK